MKRRLSHCAGSNNRIARHFSFHAKLHATSPLAAAECRLVLLYHHTRNGRNERPTQLPIQHSDIRSRRSASAAHEPLVPLHDHCVVQRDAIPRKQAYNGSDDRDRCAALWANLLSVSPCSYLLCRSTHVVLVGVDALCVKALAAVSFLLRRAQTDPHKAVKAQDDVHAGGAAWRRNVIEMRFETTDQVRRYLNELAVSQLASAGIPLHGHAPTLPYLSDRVWRDIAPSWKNAWTSATSS